MDYREQNNGYVALDGSQRQLPILEAYVGSSSVYWFKPEYAAAEMSLRIGDARKISWSEPIRMSCHPKKGLFRVYVPGANFKQRCETYYQVITVDENGNKHISGEGIIRIYSSHISEVVDESIVAYAWFPDDKARSVTITEDEVGAPIFTIGDVVDAPIGKLQTIYAFNKATGFFHIVSTFFDDVGEPMLSVSEEAIEGGADRFVLDESGFYRRIECAEDDSGSMMLQTGEKR